MNCFFSVFEVEIRISIQLIFSQADFPMCRLWATVRISTAEAEVHYLKKFIADLCPTMLSCSKVSQKYWHIPNCLTIKKNVLFATVIKSKHFFCILAGFGSPALLVIRISSEGTIDNDRMALIKKFMTYRSYSLAVKLLQNSA